MEHGVLSSLSFKLYTAERTAGALNLFSFQPGVWDTEAETIGTVFAAHAASAIMAGRHGQQMQSALSTRDRIGQAKGIIMSATASTNCALSTCCAGSLRRAKPSSPTSPSA